MDRYLNDLPPAFLFMGDQTEKEGISWREQYFKISWSFVTMPAWMQFAEAAWTFQAASALHRTPARPMMLPFIRTLFFKAPNAPFRSGIPWVRVWVEWAERTFLIVFDGRTIDFTTGMASSNDSGLSRLLNKIYHLATIFTGKNWPATVYFR